MYYTRRGDDGTSTLFAGTNRLPKDDIMFEVLGTLDELNSWIGICKASCNNLGGQDSDAIKTLLEQAQENLFIIQAQIAGADKILSEKSTEELETAINRTADKIGATHAFYLAGGCLLSAFLDVARTVARRCERVFFQAVRQNALPEMPAVLTYLNRLSSLLYVLVRLANQQKNVIEKSPRYGS